MQNTFSEKPFFGKRNNGAETKSALFMIQTPLQTTTMHTEFLHVGIRNVI